MPSCCACSTNVPAVRRRSARSRPNPRRGRAHLPPRARSPGAAPVAGSQPGPAAGRKHHLLFPRSHVGLPALEEPLGIAFLGPLGTFSESAATKHFGHAARLLPQGSIDDVFREVDSGHAQYAVVPVENSTEGAVGRTMDLLLGTQLKICGEVVLRIHQNLLSNERDLGGSPRCTRTPSRWRSATNG
jgi:hypothetical protein